MIARDSSAVDAYRAHLAEAAGDAFQGLRIAIDCANGSASAIAPRLFRELGAEVVALCADPDGSNINAGCGSTQPEALATTVAEQGLDLGFAFDGDADRLIGVDERGEIVDGDVVMGVCALDRLAAGTLARGLLVVSVMSNGGLERAISAAGGSVIRTPVGDRHVFEAMERSGAMLGGEQSGHVIFRDRATTGDGLLTAIELTKTLRAAGGATLSELASRIPRLPQVMINSAVRHKDQWQIDPEFGAAVSQATNVLRGRGRILVRPSGTEPKLRIMVEGDDSEEISDIARELARLAESRLN
jgi:phosphoglucosamine mutase